MLNNGLPLSRENPMPSEVINTVIVKKASTSDILLDDISLTAGAEEGVMVSVEGFDSVFVMALGEATYDVYSYPSPNASDMMEKETLATGVLANVGVTKKPNMLAPYLYITIKNTSAGTAKFNLWVYGV
jgi:hypothetical protein